MSGGKPVPTAIHLRATSTVHPDHCTIHRNSQLSPETDTREKKTNIFFWGGGFRPR